ncbi:MAG TPA: prepilin peptidase [Gemmataceae bacterium]|nr:prepilin peptidase [Gemmataceae bacterium]
MPDRGKIRGQVRNEPEASTTEGMSVADASGSLALLYNDSMLVAAWIAFLLIMLLLLGSAVGSFLNVCIVRLPQGRSLIRPASSCGQCGKSIRWQDNIPLVSYWRLRGRCRACGAPFSMRYFWIELLTGFLFILIYHLEIAHNIHHFQVWAWYNDDYEYALMQMFDPRQWLVFSTHAVLGCLLIVATACLWEHGWVPTRVTIAGALLGLLAALLLPWPWPDQTSPALVASSMSEIAWSNEVRVFSGGSRPGAIVAGRPWWWGEAMRHQGLYPWPVWGPLPQWLPPGNWRLGLATGLAGVLVGAVLAGLVRLLFNLGVGAEALGGGEISLLMIAGAFLGWQPIVAAALLALIPGLATATLQWTMRKRNRVSYGLWLAPALVAVWMGWYWIGPHVRGFFFDSPRMLWFAIGCVSFLIAFAACLRLVGVARPGMDS